MAEQDAPSSEDTGSTGRTVLSDGELRALAAKVYALLKEELRVERERTGRRDR